MRQLLIRTRFFLLSVILVLSWVILGFIVHSKIADMDRLNSFSVDIESLPGKIAGIKTAINEIFYIERTDPAFYARGRSEGLAAFNRMYIDVYDRIRLLQATDYFRRRSIIDQKLGNIADYLSSIQTELEHSVSLIRDIGWGDYGLTANLKSHLDSMEVIAPGMGASEHQKLMEISLLAREFLNHPSPELAGKLNSKLTLYFPPGTNRSATVSAYTTLLSQLLSRLEDKYRRLGYTPHEGHRGNISRYSGIITEESAALSELFALEAGKSVSLIKRNLGLMIIFFLIIFGTVFYLFSVSLTRPIERIRTYLGEMATGRILPVLEKEGHDEITEMTGSLNRLTSSLGEKVKFTTAITREGDSLPPEPLGPDDTLANALKDMGAHLKAAEQEDEKHREANENRRWANEGVALFGEILRSYSTDLEHLADELIKTLVRYLNASLGGLYLTDPSEQSRFDLVSSFAYDRKKYIHRSFALGEGLVGTCVIEKKRIFFTDVPEDYIRITSGLGGGKPGSLLLVPLMLKEEVLGIIELASTGTFRDHEVEFIERIGESIASTIISVRMNIRTNKLLEQSQEQARNLAEQEEKMRQSMKQLQATQDESARRESEIAGILNAIQESSLVAEYDLEEKLTSINDKFLMLLETQRDHITGRRLNEIIGISRHTDNYKELWKRLRDGESVSNVEKIKLVNGKEVWLRQTFTPIPGKDEDAVKILNIATDITETISQKESLEKQAGEITRANLEMKSFNEAVDQALIKCVYSPTGQILEINSNFETTTGYSARELIGKNNRIFLQKVEREQFDRIWEDISKDKPYSGVIRRTRPTGEQVWLMSTFTPVRNEEGTIYKVYYLGQDITERKLKYQLLEEANKEIERLKKEQNG